jgi:hypothetical protein
MTPKDPLDVRVFSLLDRTYVGLLCP